MLALYPLVGAVPASAHCCFECNVARDVSAQYSTVSVVSFGTEYAGCKDHSKIIAHMIESIGAIVQGVYSNKQPGQSELIRAERGDGLGLPGPRAWQHHLQGIRGPDHHLCQPRVPAPGHQSLPSKLLSKQPSPCWVVSVCAYVPYNCGSVSQLWCTCIHYSRLFCHCEVPRQK